MTIVFVFLFIFLSRVLFLSISPSFFDSLEYLKLFELPSLSEAIKQVHYPIHPLWIVTGWLFNRIPFSSTLFKTEFLSAVSGTLSCLFVYKIAGEFADKKKALLITLICAFTPYFWLSQTNILYEPLLGVFLLGSFWFLIKGNRTDKTNRTNRTNIILSGVFFGGAFLVSSTALIYLIFFVGYLWAKDRLGGLGILGILGGIILGVLGYLIVLRLRGIPSGEMFSVLSSGNSWWEKIRTEGVLFFVRGIRNSLVVYFNYLTIPVGIVLSYLGYLSYLNKKTRGLVFAWLFSFFLLNTIWHAGMFGRISLLLTLAPVFLLLKTENKLLLKTVLVFLMIFSSFKVLPYHFQKIPDVLEREYFQGESGNFLLIMSNYEEPYLRGGVAEYKVLNSPRTDLGEIKRWLEEKLKDNKIVLITSQAITAPYWQYDGMNYQLLSKKRKYPQAQGQSLTEKYELNKVFEIPKAKIEIYRISERNSWYTFINQ